MSETIELESQLHEKAVRHLNRILELLERALEIRQGQGQHADENFAFFAEVDALKMQARLLAGRDLGSFSCRDTASLLCDNRVFLFAYSEDDDASGFAAEMMEFWNTACELLLVGQPVGTVPSALPVAFLNSLRPNPFGMFSDLHLSSERAFPGRQAEFGGYLSQSPLIGPTFHQPWLSTGAGGALQDMLPDLSVFEAYEPDNRPEEAKPPLEGDGST